MKSTITDYLFELVHKKFHRTKFISDIEINFFFYFQSQMKKRFNNCDIIDNYMKYDIITTRFLI